MKIIAYNVNGLRAAIRKGFNEWLLEENPDVICLQEIKASPDQIDELFYISNGYETFWMPAQKKGYSGVAIFSKITPKNVVYGCGIEEYDREGRLIRIDLDNLSILSTYHPSGTSGTKRQEIKMKWLADFQEYVNKLKLTHPNLVISGDYNIAHEEIDIHNPKGNKKNSGFLPEEREWMTNYLDSGMIDTFRHFNKDPDHYSWWSMRFPTVRKENKGWRLDYHMATRSLQSRLKSAYILPNVLHSDHCPVVLELAD